MPVRSAPGGAVDITITMGPTEVEAVEASMEVLEEVTVAAVEVAATRRAMSTITRTARTRVVTV